MRKEKHLAFELRKSGKSYNAISSELNIPKSTLSEWFSGVHWSDSIRDELTRKAFLRVYPKLLAMNRARIKMWEEWRRAAREAAHREFPKLRRDPLFISGVMLYWGEGDRIPKNPVRMTNSDPRLLSLFVKFLKNKCSVSKVKVKAHLILYPDLEEEKMKQFWVKRIGIGRRFFNKTQYIRGSGGTKRLKTGLCVVEVSSRQLKEKLLVWIEEFSKYL